MKHRPEHGQPRGAFPGRPLDVAAELDLDAVEFPTGAWSSAPHVDLDGLLDSEAARDELLGRVRDRDLSISALTCNGNQLTPSAGRRTTT